MPDCISKQFPPSKSRLAAAARQGLLWNAPFSVFGAALTLAGGTGLALLQHTQLFAFPLTDQALQSPHPDLPAMMMTQLWRIFAHAALLGLPAGALLVTGLVWTHRQKKGGLTNVPIPDEFSTFKSDTIIGALTLLTGGLIAIATFKNGGFSYTEIEFAPAAAAHRLLEVMFWSCIGAGVVAILGGLIQLSVRRTQLLRHLSLTRSEQQTEQRLHGHSPTRGQIGLKQQPVATERQSASAIPD
ncbi:MAG: hypothetical protein JXX14_01165 [Deltaproteobacteria bacterium]|nr:hypothetical protein [Deltaproteobacteria bacterium]